MAVEKIIKGKMAVGTLEIEDKVLPTDVIYTITASTTNACIVDAQLVSKDEAIISARQAMDIYLSGDATGDAVYSAAGTVAITDGFALGAYTANLAYPCITDETGKLSFKITYASKPEIYVCAVPQSTGHVAVSRKLVTTDYGV